MANDWLEILRRKQQRVIQLREELAELESELREGRAILTGKNAAPPVPAKPKSRHGFTGGKRAKPIQSGSSVWWTERVLQDAGEPLHVDAILRHIKQEGGIEFVKNTLVSNLSRYVAHGDTFTRTAPSTYGLTAWTANTAVALFSVGSPSPTSDVPDPESDDFPEPEPEDDYPEPPEDWNEGDE